MRHDELQSTILMTGSHCETWQSQHPKQASHWPREGSRALDGVSIQTAWIRGHWVEEIGGLRGPTNNEQCHSGKTGPLTPQPKARLLQPSSRPDANLLAQRYNVGAFSQSLERPLLDMEAMEKMEGASKSRKHVQMSCYLKPRARNTMANQVWDAGNNDAAASEMRGRSEPMGSFTVGCRVMVEIFHQQQHGIVRFCGRTKFADGVLVGVELDKPKGKNDGTVEGTLYFTCPPKHGLFIRPHCVRMVAAASQVDLEEEANEGDEEQWDEDQEDEEQWDEDHPDEYHEDHPTPLQDEEQCDGDEEDNEGEDVDEGEEEEENSF